MLAKLFEKLRKRFLKILRVRKERYMINVRNSRNIMNMYAFCSLTNSLTKSRIMDDHCNKGFSHKK